MVMGRATVTASAMNGDLRKVDALPTKTHEPTIMPPHRRMDADHTAPENPLPSNNGGETQHVTRTDTAAGPSPRIDGQRLPQQVAKESPLFEPAKAATTNTEGILTTAKGDATTSGESLDPGQAACESSPTAEQAVLPGMALLTSIDTSSLRRSPSKESSSHHHHHNSSIRMEDVGFLMREQDADLLESIQRNGPNRTGMTPALNAGRIEFDRVSQIPSISLDDVSKNETGSNINSASSNKNQHHIIHSSVSAPCFAENSTAASTGSSTPNLNKLVQQQPQQRNRLPLFLQSSSSAGPAAAASSASNRSISRSPVARQTSNDERAVSEEMNSVQQQQPTPPHFSPLRLKERQVSFTRQLSGGGLDVSTPSYLPEPLDTSRRALSGDIYLRDQDQQDGSVLSDRDSTLDDFNFDASDLDNEKILRRSESDERRISEAAQFAEAVGDLPLVEQEDLRIIDEINDDGVEVDDDDDDDDDATVVQVERSRMLRPPSKKAASKRTVASDAAAGDGMEAEIIAQDHHNQLDNRSTHTAKSTSSCVVPAAPFVVPETPVKIRPQWPSPQYETRHTDPGATSFHLSPSRRAAFLAQLPSSTSTQDFVYKGIRANPPEIIKRGTTRGNYAQLHRKAWLEVSDKYHRYGKHLRLYYRFWERLGFPTNSFFDWLDSKGEAAGQPLPEIEECPRSQLDSDTVLYITNPDITANYALQLIAEETTVADDDGNAEVMRRGRVVDVDGDPVQTGPDGWIFVLRDNVLYGSQKITSVLGHSKQRFHHSSFFGGKAVAAAGIFLTDEDGFLTRLYPHSGHYRPGEAHVQRVLFFVFHEGIDLRTFEMDVQQIQHVSRDGLTAKERSAAKEALKDSEKNKENGEEVAKPEKKKKMESLQLVPAVLVACFLAHKARFIGEGIFTQIHQIRKMEVTSVEEALDVIDNGGFWKNKSSDVVVA